MCILNKHLRYTHLTSKSGGIYTFFGHIAVAISGIYILRFAHHDLFSIFHALFSCRGEVSQHTEQLYFIVCFHLNAWVCTTLVAAHAQHDTHLYYEEIKHIATSCLIACTRRFAAYSTKSLDIVLRHCSGWLHWNLDPYSSDCLAPVVLFRGHFMQIQCLKIKLVPELFNVS